MMKLRVCLTSWLMCYRDFDTMCVKIKQGRNTIGMQLVAGLQFRGGAHFSTLKAMGKNKKDTYPKVLAYFLHG